MTLIIRIQIQVDWAPEPTPKALIIMGRMMVVRSPGSMVVPVLVSMASPSRCFVSRVDSGTMRTWLIL